jgi:type VI secretion system secreted protein VgrG
MIQAKDHVLFTAGGAYIKLGANGGNDIEIHAPGMVEFKAELKSWASAKSDSNSLSLPTSKLTQCSSALAAAAAAGSSVV